jgi:glycosyltransferase involved in cell wall biosynthesis
MSSDPYISIIIPAYNAQDWIADALSSCVRQQYNPVEIIVVDDGSTDNTYAIASRYTNANMNVRVLRTGNKGASAARNTGLSNANGEYLLFLDADDVLADNALQICGSIAGRTKADAVLGAVSSFDHLTGEHTGPLTIKLVYRDAYANAARFRWFQGSALLRNTDLRWNEQRTIWEGLEYILDFLASDRRTEYTESLVVKVRQHGSTTRISSRFDHFEPAMTGAFFVECKEKLRLCENLSAERASALDFHILANAYALLRSGRGREADRLIDEVNWPDVPRYDWYHFGSLPWATYWGGRRCGSRSFYLINRLLGRV